jgi:hypothetical protein
LARVFPQLERNVRERQDFGEAFSQETGEVAVRGLRVVGDESRGRTITAIDGHSGAVLKLYREHLMSSDQSFLKRNWTGAKKALQWLIEQDGNRDGLIEGRQPNTYDIAFTGANTYVGALYLAALKAGSRMAKAMGEDEYAIELDQIARTGASLTLERLWNGEYFFQELGSEQFPQSQYGTGCLADQLFGQQWAHQLNLGYLYPQMNVRRALKSIWKYNWAPDVFSQNRVHRPERVYANPGESGLFICTWPKSLHPGDKAVRYKNEVWTGIEYQVAAHMLYEGMLEEGLAILRAIHERYDGRKHNPWNEVECGDHYARSLASWGCLVAIEGYYCDGPGGEISFAPRLSPEDFKGFFTGPMGWGTLVQKRIGSRQTNRIEVKWGTLAVKTVEVEVPTGVKVRTAEVEAPQGGLSVRIHRKGSRIRLECDEAVTVSSGQFLEAKVEWSS